MCLVPANRFGSYQFKKAIHAQPTAMNLCFNFSNELSSPSYRHNTIVFNLRFKFTVDTAYSLEVPEYWSQYHCYFSPLLVAITRAQNWKKNIASPAPYKSKWHNATLRNQAQEITATSTISHSSVHTKYKDFWVHAQENMVAFSALLTLSLPKFEYKLRRKILIRH